MQSSTLAYADWTWILMQNSMDDNVENSTERPKQ